MPLASGGADEPQLQDPGGDLYYEMLASGAGPMVDDGANHDFIDVLAAWFEARDNGSRLAVVLEVVDSSALANPTDDISAECALRTGIFDDGERVGGAAVEWSYNLNPGSLNSARPGLQHSAAVTGDTGGEHTFQVIAGAPGRYEWNLPADPFRRLGADELQDHDVLCRSSKTLYNKQDDASSMNTYDLEGITLSPSNQDSVDRLEDYVGDIPSGDGPQDTPRATPAIGVIGVVLASGLAVLGRAAAARRRR